MTQTLMVQQLDLTKFKLQWNTSTNKIILSFHTNTKRLKINKNKKKVKKYKLCDDPDRSHPEMFPSAIASEFCDVIKSTRFENKLDGCAYTSWIGSRRA